MFEGLKLSGWKQGIFQEKSTRQHVIGEKRHWNNKIFRYAKNGSTALGRGKLNSSVKYNAGIVNQAITAAIATGTRQMTLTVTAGAAFVANDLKGSDFIINDVDGEGQCIPIVANTALAAAGTSITISSVQVNSLPSR